MTNLRTGIILLSVSLLASACDELADQDMGSEANAGDVEQSVTGGICPKGSTVKGIDVSYYQGTVHWSSVKSSGVQFGVARISDGDNFIDPQFSTNWKNMKSAGIIRGAYQFFEPGQSASAQADVVISRVGKLGDGDLPVMLDVEVTGGQSSGTIRDKIHTWVDKVKAGTGKTPYIYTGAYFWDDNVHTSDFAGLPLNVAWYGTNCPGVPSAWSGHGWMFHQYTSSASVPGVSGNVDADVFNGTSSQLKAFASGGASCHHTTGPFTWTCNGPVSGQHCTRITEPADPDTWGDNYLCTHDDLGIRWSHAGPIDGMRCTKTHEGSDPDTWGDNYLCVPKVSPFHFHWSSAGAIDGEKCVKWDEPADHDTWSDNYLCWSSHDDAVQLRGPFGWSSRGPIDGMSCTQIAEGADPDTWNDNYFCADTDIGLRWSNRGAIDGMTCTQIHEGADPHTWNDNYLCAPADAAYEFDWSSAGPLDPDQNCIAWYEGADKDTWDDNYLCWTDLAQDPQTTMPPPGELEPGPTVEMTTAE